jgi:hypothetical protein
MGVATLMTTCAGCGAPLICNPVRVPSIRVNGQREAICKACFDKWNVIHRTSKGLQPEPLHPDAYSACQESELG